MKIFILSDGYAPHTRRWVNWFAENNHQVFLITFNSRVLPNYSEKVKEIFIINPKYIGGLYVGKFLGILFLLTRLLIKYLIEKPDLVHSHTSGGYAWAPFLLRLKNRFITPWGTDILVDINESKKGENTIVLDELKDGVYENCSLTVIDDAGNRSDQLTLSKFTIYT